MAASEEARPCANNSSSAGSQKFGFPKSVRILRRSDYRKVYDEGFRHSCPLFAAFCLRVPAMPVEAPEVEAPKVGFTVPRALGKAVYRNRMKRRVREAVRLHLAELAPVWWIVFNPRRTVLDASFEDLQREVSRLFQRCGQT